MATRSPSPVRNEKPTRRLAAAKPLTLNERRAQAIAALAGTPFGGLIEAFAHIPAGKIKAWPVSK